MFYSVILEYTPMINSINTSVLEPTKLLIVLKDIWGAKSGLIPRISFVIIEKTCYRDL